MSGLGYDKIKQAYFWLIYKRYQIAIRSHLSHFLALVLVILVTYREWNEILEFIQHPLSLSLWNAFVLSVLLGTIAAALWEFFGNKLATSEQEIRFITGMRTLLIELEKHKLEISSADINQSQRLLNNFVRNFLEITSSALCGKKDVHSGLMFYNNDHGTNKLSLFMSSPGAMYPKILNLPIGDGVNQDEKGPACMAFESGFLAHMPKKGNKFGFLFSEVAGEKFEFERYFHGWFPAQSLNEEDFRSVLSVPVTSYVSQGEKVNHGVLNFTTSSGDLFVPRDYIMALCFASILAQVIDLTRARVARIQELSATPAPITNRVAPKKKIRGGLRKN